MNKLLLVAVIFFAVILKTTVLPIKVYAASPSATINQLAGAPTLVADYRAKILSDYLKQYNSPLADYAQTFVLEADKNDIDWKLLPAIAGLESTFGQNIPYNSYNAWGWGIFGDQTKRFNSWDEAIETISKGLRENYINKLKTDDVYAIGRVYAASPTWAQRVEHIMNDIEKFSKTNPSYALSLSI